MTRSSEKRPFWFDGTFTTTELNPGTLNMPSLPDEGDSKVITCTEVGGDDHNATVLKAEVMRRIIGSDGRSVMVIESFDSAHVNNETYCIIKMFHEESKARKEYDVLKKLGGLQGTCPEAFALGQFEGTNNDGKPISGPAIVMERLPTAGEGGFYLLDDIDSIYEAMGVQRIHCPHPIQTASFVYQLSSAVSLLANRGYSHKDLKPGNIIVGVGPSDLETVGGNGKVCTRVLLIDLGSASKTTDDATPIYLSGRKRYVDADRNPHMGTPPYSAPELFDVDLTDGAPYNSKTGKLTGEWWEFRNKRSVDVWSVGTLLYFFHMGEKPPFTIDDLVPDTNLRARIMKPLSEVASNWSLDQITYLIDSPKGRAQSAIEKILRLSTIPNPKDRQEALPDGAQSIIRILHDALPAEFPMKSGTGPNPYNDSADDGATPEVTSWSVDAETATPEKSWSDGKISKESSSALYGGHDQAKTAGEGVSGGIGVSASSAAGSHHPPSPNPKTTTGTTKVPTRHTSDRSFVVAALLVILFVIGTAAMLVLLLSGTISPETGRVDLVFAIARGVSLMVGIGLLIVAPFKERGERVPWVALSIICLVVCAMLVFIPTALFGQDF